MLKMKNIVLVALFFIGNMGAINTPDQKHCLEKGKDEISVFYSEKYNFPCSWLLQKLQPFDLKKYMKIAAALKKYAHPNVCFYEPSAVTDEQLRLVHTPDYLTSLRNNVRVWQLVYEQDRLSLKSFIERAVASLLPAAVSDWLILSPMRHATGGTIAAVAKALETKSCAINLGGGYHHASAGDGGAGCIYSDIAIAVEEAWKKDPKLKIMIVDLDAHQGNGYESIFKNDPRISMFDMFNAVNYPSGRVPTAIAVRKYITYSLSITGLIQDGIYLEALKKHLPFAIDKEKPDLIIYNAGTDPLRGDPYGGMYLSYEGLLERDRFVFQETKNKKVPVAMLLAGGYTEQSAHLVADSIIKNAVPIFSNAASCNRQDALDYPDNTAMCVG